MYKSLYRYSILFLGPVLLCFLIAFIVPFIYGVVLSFAKFTSVTNVTWVGFRNYIDAFANKDFLNALGFSTVFTVVSVVIINVSAFTLALFLTSGVQGTNLYRTLIFMPNLIGGIVLGYIWQFIINGALKFMGVTINTSAICGFWGLVILSSWQFIGYMMIIYIAGLQNISTEVLEAAKIDGAGRWAVLSKIKIPLVMPSITITMFMTIANSFKMFDQNLSLTAGLPGKETVMVSLDVFNTFYNRSGFEGVGQAKAMMFFLLVVIITLFQLNITRKREVEN
ncbi:MAG: sugar ABC transporter permease [Spirochaetaceae bacterium]|jgi:raffinose/stachyose/melibiose transport system permease protein|nr:sugar ABC transporter permease [Spirochaetaceae bacterium]